MASASKIVLTKRGKAVLVMFFSVLALAASLLMQQLNTADAVATDTGSNYGYVIPEAGETLWSIAKQLAPASDPREVVADLMEFNQLSGVSVKAYEPLAVPQKYMHAPRVTPAG